MRTKDISNLKKQQILSCFPKKWQEFYNSCPNMFGQDYLNRNKISRDDFLEFNRNGKLFDYLYFEANPSDVIYKMPLADSKDLLITTRQRTLYNELPNNFSYTILNNSRLKLKYPKTVMLGLINCQLIVWNKSLLIWKLKDESIFNKSVLKPYSV